MSKAEIYFRLAKADETNPDVLKIEGLATSGKETDRGGERLNYPGSKPYFLEWSRAIANATDGKSQGNIRQQHDPELAVGKIDRLIFDDAKEEIRIVASIVDRDTRAKILAGVLSGLSIAGRYVKRWVENGIDWYICEPNEISVCDFPSLPSATFQVIKSSGLEIRHFQKGENSMNSEQLRDYTSKARAHLRTVADCHKSEAASHRQMVKYAASRTEQPGDLYAAARAFHQTAADGCDEKAAAAETFADALKLVANAGFDGGKAAFLTDLQKAIAGSLVDPSGGLRRVVV